MIFALRAALKSKLEATGKFVNVYDYHTLKKDGFPYCTFDLSQFEGKFLDSCSNERVFRFKVIILHVINDDFPMETVVQILYRALEQVIQDFDGDMDFGESLIIRGDVSSGEVGVIVEDNGQTMAIDLSIDLTTVINAQQ